MDARLRPGKRLTGAACWSVSSWLTSDCFLLAFAFAQLSVCWTYLSLGFFPILRLMTKMAAACKKRMKGG